MAKLSDRQKANIKAKFKTGQYSKTDLAKSYKVDEKTIRKVLGDTKPENADIIEAAVMLEHVKNSEKSPLEVREINRSIEYRLREEFDKDKLKVTIYETQLAAVNAIKEKIRSGKRQAIVKLGSKEDQYVDVVEVDLDSSDYKNYVDAIDKASVTMNVNDRHAPKGDVNVQTNVQQSVAKIERHIIDGEE